MKYIWPVIPLLLWSFNWSSRHQSTETFQQPSPCFVFCCCWCCCCCLPSYIGRVRNGLKEVCESMMYSLPPELRTVSSPSCSLAVPDLRVADANSSSAEEKSLGAEDDSKEVKRKWVIVASRSTGTAFVCSVHVICLHLWRVLKLISQVFNWVSFWF